MQIRQYRAFILIITAALALMVVSPTVGRLLVIPQSTHLTEMALLDSNRTTNYPSNVSVGEPLGLFLEITNHMDAVSYYVIEVKFRNETQSGPNSFVHTGSDLEPLNRFSLILANKETVQLPISVSFDYKIDPTAEKLYMESIALNGLPIELNGTSIAWNPERRGYLGNLFFELWIYNDTSSILHYHERYVGLWLKMT